MFGRSIQIGLVSVVLCCTGVFAIADDERKPLEGYCVWGSRLTKKLMIGCLVRCLNLLGVRIALQCLVLRLKSQNDLGIIIRR